MKSQIRLSGSGGQGLILAGILLAEAATIEGKNVLQSQSYGPESRGGKSRADVIISDKSIYYPNAVDLDILLCLSQEAADEYICMLKRGGMLIYDSSNININPIESETVAEPFNEIALDRLGTSMVMNILSLGFISKLTGIVKKKNLAKVIEDKVKEKFIEIDLKALDEGVKLAKEYNTKKEPNKKS